MKSKLFYYHQKLETIQVQQINTKTSTILIISESSTEFIDLIMSRQKRPYDLLPDYQIQSQLTQLIIKENMRRVYESRYETSRGETEYNSLQSLLRMIGKTELHDKENTDKHDPCKKYLGTQVLIKKDGYGLDKKLKKLKSTIVEKLSSGKDLMVYKSNVYPMIFFKYTEKMGLPKYKHLRQVFRECPKLREKRQLIDSIFERLFLKVERGYFNIGSFALDRAQQIKVKMQKGDIFNLQQGKQVMFYFLKNEDDKTVKFTIFDRSMRSIEFDSEFIEQNKLKHPQYYKLYQKFMKNVFQEEKEFQLNDIFDNEELESDQELIEEDKMTIYQIKRKLNEILEKDLSQYQSKIQSIQQEINQAGEDNQNIKVLTEKKEDISDNMANFSQTKLQVSRIMRRQSSQAAYKNCLKKMIVAEKQLESQLPIVAKKRKIFELLRKQNFILLEGQTGSGKSTQLPQMLCELYNLFDDSLAKPVLVTQPRRLAARSLAERVASQMGEHVGGFVDYVASAGKTVSKEAKIIFKLDRLVLDEITEDPLLSNYSCLVIDEAHERTISIDVILALVKQLLRQRKDFKVIVTSASMDIPLFQRYFNSKAFKVSGQVYPIKITYKDYDKFKEGDQHQMVHKIRKVIDEEILHDASSMKSDFKGHLLCFFSSVEEINQLVKFYTQKLNKHVFSVYPLHGKISPKDQKRVFQEAGKHKIIFASRIAETAITIDGVRVVIDPGQDIQLVYDRIYKISSMKLKDISQSSAKQRAGRSGRTGPGHCFRLYSQVSFKKRKLNKAPQIENSSLETAVLRLKTIKIKDVMKFPFISIPDEESLRNSLDLLELIGALKDKSSDYEPTEIGKLLVKMPIEPFLGRAIIESMIFEKAFETQRKNIKMEKSQIKEVQELGIMETTIQILSLLINFSGLFLIEKSEKQKGLKIKYTQFSDEDGDFFFLMNIFNKYKTLKKSEMKSNKVKSKYYKNSSELSKWIQRNYLNTRALVEAEKLAQEITFVARRFFIHQILLAGQIKRVKQKLHQCKSFKQIILSSLITSFCSNLCKFSGNPQIGYTIVTQRRPIRIYGTSNLQYLGINADWIICFDLYTNDVGRLFCKVAHQVSYNFLKVHVHEYAWKKYRIQSIQDNNPFYEELSYELPTKIIQQIRNDFQKQEENNSKLPFLKDMFPVFSDYKNRVSFFLILDENNMEAAIMAKTIKINQYIKELKETTYSRYQHNFVGSIYANFENGLVVDDIEYKFNEFCVQITSVTIIIEHFLKICSEYGNFTIFDLDSFEMRKFKGNYSHIAYQFQKLRFIPNNQNDKAKFLGYVEKMTKSFQQIPIEKRQIPLHQGNKTSQSKVYLYFYAGRCAANPTIFMKYDTRNQHDIAFKMLDAIKEGASKKYRRAVMTGEVDKIKFIPEKMKPSKKRNGINLFEHNFDEFQLSGELQRMVKEGFLPDNFVYPSAISKFRDPVLEEASKNDYQWRQEIYSILKAIKLKRQSLIINITGFNNTRKSNYGQIYGKNIRVIMTAQIFSIDNTNLEQIKPNFQGKKILGCEKMHVRNFYDQTVALVNKRVFEALEFQYYQLVDKYKVKFPQMRLMKVNKKVGNEQKYLIIARSQNKGDSSQIQSEIQRLFTPKLLRLQPQQYRFLNELEDGQAILDDIEQDYNYKIYFSFEKYNKCLKIYCKDYELKVIEALLKTRIKSYRYCTQTISYRGKNLNVVRSILDKYTENKRKEVVMTYEIRFQSREISITAGLDTFEQIKQNIARIAETSKGQCEICADSMKNPYQFLNCSCSFCWQCLTDHIRSFRNSTEKILLCPNQECKTPININDVKTIMNEQEFQQICDLKIRQYLEIHHDKFYSCNVCQHVMDRKSVERNAQMSCQVCRKNQCLKCHESHQGYTCSDWKDRNNLTSKLTEFGIKICKNCGQGIQKNGGCNHMTCTRCKAHICWKCEQVFATREKCQEHLIRRHEGIFDAGIRE